MKFVLPLLLAACAPVGASVPPELHEHHDLAVDLGLPATKAALKDDGRGQIRVRVIDEWPEDYKPKEHQAGRHYREGLCKARVDILRTYMQNNPTVTAHEYGHAFGLKHRKRDQNNLMYPQASPKRTELTRWQRFVIKLGAAFLSACKRIPQ